MVTEIAPVRAVNMPIGAFCTEFRRERFCGDDAFGNQGRQKVAVTYKLKFGTKMVAMKAVNFSTIPFRTEFWCESNRDDGILPNPLF